MKKGNAGAVPVEFSRGPLIWSGIFGSFLLLALLKFPNPAILESWTTPPIDIFDFIFGSAWPIKWAYAMLAAVTAGGVIACKPRLSVPLWLIVLPAAWFVWTLIAATLSTDGTLSWGTEKHFAATLACFYLGAFCLSRVESPWPFWLALFIGFSVVVYSGLNQHFGGLKQTRDYFFQSIYPQLKGSASELQPGFLAKMNSDRVFGPLFYPNALAGAVLMLLPPLAALTLRCRKLTLAARRFVAAVLGVGSLGCLYWSGSKGGWLLALFIGLLVLLRLPIPSKWKSALIITGLVIGVTGFYMRYAGYFGKGAKSAVARVDYWKAAARVTQDHPLVGSGPGTFWSSYQKIKDPTSEPARLVHNDYIEQASDSGVPAALLYTGFVALALAFTFPWRNGALTAYCVWLGILGFALQSLMEFPLYLPSLAWPSFAMLGMLAGRAFNDRIASTSKTPVPTLAAKS
jgi:O-antigen ligase